MKRYPLLPSAELLFDGSAGTFNIEARVIDTNNVTVAALQPRNVSVSEPVQIPLELVKAVPVQCAQRVDTKAQIALCFNQSIDASQLEVTVFETAFGKTWLNQDAHGTEFFNAKAHQLVDVQRDHQITKVGVQLG